MKAGWKTSEFYVAIAGIAGLVWTFTQSHCQVSQAEAVSFAGVVISYVIGRSWLKRNAQ